MSKRVLYLVWATIALVLLLSAGRLLAWPDRLSGETQSPLLISEFLATNETGIQDDSGEHVDWIEIHNRSRETVNLAGWTLSDRADNADRWALPDLEMAPGTYLLIFASGKDEVVGADSLSEVPILHTGFRLDSAPGFLGLFPPTSRRYLDADTIFYPAQTSDQSYGRCPTGETFCFFATPTPGEPNSPEAIPSPLGNRLLPPPSFSVERGFYDSPFTVELSTDIGDARIQYTLDGSDPSYTHGEIYENPIRIEHSTVLKAAIFRSDQLSSPPLAHTYIFPSDVISQPADPPGYPQTWGTHRIDILSYKAGDPVRADYAMDPEVSGHPRMGESLSALPVMALSTAVDNLDIYFGDPQMRGPEAERPVAVEYFVPGDDDAQFYVNAGMRIQGGVARWEYMPKHPLRLFFKQQYGSATLDYPLFPDSFVQEFNTLILRAGANRSFAAFPAENILETTYVRDEWARASQIAMSGVGSHGTFVHLYLNGLYWGVYNLVERPDAAFLASYLGGERDSWYVANHGGSVSGPEDRFRVLLQLAEDGRLADPDRYATMLEFVDPEQFSDYVIVNWYAGTRDWPDTNWYVGVHYPAGRNLFFEWDAEGSWEDGADIALGPEGKEGAPFPNVTKLVFEALIENPDFRLTFADRLYQHLFNDGALTDENAQARFMTIAEQVEPAILAESARWGDVRREDPVTPDDWQRAVANVLAQMEGNAAKLLSLVRDAGYYPSLEPPQWSQHGGQFSGELSLSMSSPRGEIYYTTDGTDPRQSVSGEVAASAQRYETPLKLTRETTVKARGWDEGEWSPLRASTFHEAAEEAHVFISEVMYNPPDGSDAEFIELYNAGTATYDLSQAHFTGIDFIFPLGASLAPGEYAVLIRDYDAYRQLYPQAPFRGFYRGNLANAGETITLRDRHGQIIDSVTYDDAGGWPVNADGLGDSLVRIRLQGTLSDRSHWRVSRVLYGTPGGPDPQQLESLIPHR